MDRNFADWSRGRSPEAAWAECPRADWMIQVAAEAGAGPALLVRAAAAVWRLLWLARVPAGDPRPLAAIEAAEGWAARSSAEGPEERRAACRVLRKAADNSADCARLSYCRGEPLGAVWAASAAYEIAYTAFRLACGARPEWCDWGDVLPSSPEDLIRAADAVRALIPFPRVAQAAA